MRTTQDLKEKAKHWLQAVYTGDTSIVDELAAEDVAITYPIFQQVFDTPTLRGKDSLRKFITRFATRWAEGKLTCHELIEEGDQVVLMWSFEARNIAPLDPDQPATNKVHSWGGITIIQFDRDGRVIAEIGEESSPGPAVRLTSD